MRSRDIGEKAKQNSARTNSKCSKCFHLLCNNSDRTWFFNALTFAVPWEVLKTAAFGLEGTVFNTSHGTWRTLMHEKPCLIPILLLSAVSVKCFQNDHEIPCKESYFNCTGNGNAYSPEFLMWTPCLDLDKSIVSNRDVSKK